VLYLNWKYSSPSKDVSAVWKIALLASSISRKSHSHHYDDSATIVRYFYASVPTAVGSSLTGMWTQDLYRAQPIIVHTRPDYFRDCSETNYAVHQKFFQGLNKIKSCCVRDFLKELDHAVKLQCAGIELLERILLFLLLDHCIIQSYADIYNGTKKSHLLDKCTKHLE